MSDRGGLFIDRYGVTMFGYFLFVVCFLVGFGAVGLTVQNHSTHVECLRIHEQTGYDTRTVGVFVPTCYVHTPSGWIPSDKWRGLNGAS